MKKEGCEARTLIVLAVGVGFGLIIGAAVLAAAYPVFQSENWAAWIQAIGSIAAIAGAVFAAREGANAAARLKEVKQKRAVLAVVESFLDKVNEIAVVVAAPDDLVNLEFYETYAPSSLDGFLHTMDIVPVLELPTPVAMSAMLNLQRQARLFVSAADELGVGPWSPKISTYEHLVKARNKFEFCKNEYSLGDPATAQAQIELNNLLCASYRNLKWSLSILADSVRSEASTLRQELS